MARALKVGILTFHKCINYGSYWQARCLAEGLRARKLRAEARCALQPKLPDRTPRHELPNYVAKARR